MMRFFKQPVRNILMVALLLLLILFGDGKQSIVDAIAAAGLIFSFIVNILKGKKYVPAAPVLHGLWVALLSYLIIHVFYSLSSGYSVTSVLRYLMAYIAFMFFSLKENRGTSDQFYELLETFGICAVLLSFIVIIFHAIGVALPGMNLLYPDYGHNQIANIIVFVLPVVFYRLINKPTILNVLSFLLIFISLVTSFARGAMILMFLYFCVILVFEKRSTVRKAISLPLLFIAGITIFFVFFQNSIPPQIRNNPFVERQMMKPSVVLSRIYYWKEAAKAIVSRPLFGAGPGTYYLLSKQYQGIPDSYSLYAHSFFAESLAELGILGFFIFVSLLGYCAYQIILRPKSETIGSRLRNPLLHGITLTVLYSFYEVNLNFLVIWLLFWFSLSFLYWTLSDTGKSTRQSVTVVFSLLLVGLYYLSVVGASMAQVLTHNPEFPLFFAPYRPDLAIIYLTDYPRMSGSFQQVEPFIVAFHGNDPEVLIELARYERRNDISMMDKYYQAAIQRDPQNNMYIQEFSAILIHEKRYEQLLWIIKTITTSASQNPKKDIEFVAKHWATLYPCFNPDTLLWPKGQMANTYQAKSLYYAGLCLIKIDKFDEARELLRIAAGADTGWSNIYLDYAALSKWKYNDIAEERRVIDLCEANQHAKQHCSEYNGRMLPQTSVTDSGVVFIR